MHGRTEEGRLRSTLDVAQSLVEHISNELLHISVFLILHGVFLAIGRNVVFHQQRSQHNRLLAIFFYRHNHFFIVVYGIIHALGRVLRLGNTTEKTFNFCLHLIYIDVAHHNNGLQIGAIPFLIIIVEVLIGKMIYNVHRTDRQTSFVFGSFVNYG